MKLRHPHWRVRMARRQRHRQPRRSLVMRWTPPASTPALWQSTWNLRCSTPSSAKCEAHFLLDHLNLSLKCIFVMYLPELLPLQKINGMSYLCFVLFCSCGEVVTKREQFNDLSIDLPRRKKTLPLRSIQDSLDLFFRVCPLHKRVIVHS